MSDLQQGTTSFNIVNGQLQLSFSYPVASLETAIGSAIAGMLNPFKAKLQVKPQSIVPPSVWAALIEGLFEDLQLEIQKLIGLSPVLPTP